jgi:ligand-binding SRPBCC domain-containing protein
MMKHQHFFKPCDNGTIMIDIFQFETPYKLFGSIVNKIYLTGYMKALLDERNRVIKETAEGSRWKNYLL